jgi:3-oxoacyl-[acyl-carrier protein] reductase
MDLGLRGRACVVTGASSGIGLATAGQLVAEGAHVLMVGRSPERLLVAAERVAAGVAGAVATLALDVTEPDAADRIAHACTAQFGEADVLVNNAGTTFARAPEDLGEEDWQRLWELHVMASWRLMQRLAPSMAERGWGRIVNVASSAGKRPSLNNMAYSVTKAAQLSLSRAFADLYASRAVLVNAVAPGPVSSPLWVQPGGMADQMAALQHSSREQALGRQAAKVPLGRFAEPEEVAAAIVFLCSERASTVAGAAWSVDGGTVAVII